MKKNIIFITCLLIYFNSTAQQLTIFSTKQGTITDTLKFGFMEGATIGLDEALGEISINTIDEDVDIIIRQRTKTNFSCLYQITDTTTQLTDSIYFPTSFSCQINYRPYGIENDFGYFEIEILDEEVDGFIIESNEELNEVIDYGIAYLDSCWIADLVQLNFLNGFNSFQYNFEEITYLNYVLAQNITSVKVMKVDKKIEIFPNPFIDNIKIKNSEYHNNMFISIFDVYGRQVYSGQIKKQINLSHLYTGVYFYRIYKSNDLKVSNMSTGIIYKMANFLDDNKYIFTWKEESDEVKSMERNIYNDVISTVVNKDGLLQIGNEVFRFTYANFYSTNIDNIDLLLVDNIDANNSKITTKEVKREFIFEDTTMPSLRSVNEGSCTEEAGNSRVIGEIVSEELFVKDCNMITKLQKRNNSTSNWKNKKGNVSVSFSGNFVKVGSSCSPTPSAFFSGSGSESNKSKVTRTVKGNHSSWNGCNGRVSPFHDGVYSSSHTANGITCILSCPPGVTCQ